MHFFYAFPGVTEPGNVLIPARTDRSGSEPFRQGDSRAPAPAPAGACIRHRHPYAAMTSSPTASLYGRRRSPSSTSSPTDTSFAPYPSLAASLFRAA